MTDWSLQSDAVPVPPLQVYGIPKALFSPITDLQRFFRLGYADVTTTAESHSSAGDAACLLGVTLSLRQCVILLFRLFAI